MKKFNSAKYRNLLSECNRSPLIALFEATKGRGLIKEELTKLFNKYIGIEDYGSRKQKGEVLEDFIKRDQNYIPKKEIERRVSSFRYEPPLSYIKWRV